MYKINIRNIWKKYEEAALYIVFGAVTTVVNILGYYICVYWLQINSVVEATVIAWTVSVLFAYITNKVWVFKKRTINGSVIIYELFSFFGARLVTGILDVFIMYFFVNVLAFNDMMIKILSNILIIILNYVASKFLIFK